MGQFWLFYWKVSGKDTLHETVGIAYQTVITDDSNETEHNTKTSSANAPNQQSYEQKSAKSI